MPIGGKGLKMHVLRPWHALAIVLLSGCLGGVPVQDPGVVQAIAQTGCIAYCGPGYRCNPETRWCEPVAPPDAGFCKPDSPTCR